MLTDFINMELVLSVFVIFVKIMIVTSALFLSPLILTWIERKIAAHIQARLGPFRVGYHGLLQAVADTIKILTKEDTMPNNADKWLFKIAPAIALVPAMMVYVAIPFGDTITLPFIGEQTLYISNMDVGLLYVLAIGGLSVYGFIFGGWASNSKYALLGGLRSSAQMISYEVALSFACIGVVMLTNSLNLVDIVNKQTGGWWGIGGWNFFAFPVGPVWFMIFLIAGLAEINRVPFDLTEDEGTLAAGYQVEYSGMRFSFFALTEYVAMITISVLAVLLFFGGWSAPFGLPELPLVWFIVKTSVFIYFFMWLRFTLPRYRFDQLMTIGWKVLIPISLVTLLVTGFMVIG